MTMLKKGDKGKAVEELQTQLNAIQAAGLVVDGDFGKKTANAVKVFQKHRNFYPSGDADLHTIQVINTVYKRTKKGWWKYPKRFVVFVDAGHGGIDDDIKYTTAPSKMYHHKNIPAHHGGLYYEGLENRLAAELFIEEATKVGIMCIRTYHPFEDTSLQDRVDLVKSYLDRGYYGYLHSFHSNAISNSYSKERKDKTRGGIVFTTRGNNLSDSIAAVHIKNLQERFGDWVWTKDKPDGGNDWEANFKILRDTDLAKYAGQFGAMLEEFGFHTSEPDTEFIIENRLDRAVAGVDTAKIIRGKLEWWLDYIDK